MPNLNKEELPETLVNESMDEQETLISFTRGDKAISIYTSDNIMWHRLIKLVRANPEVYRVVEIQKANNKPVAAIVEAPLNCLSLRSGKKREMSDERKAELADRMRELAAARRGE